MTIRSAPTKSVSLVLTYSVAARVVIVGHMRAAVRLGGEQANLTRSVIGIGDSVAIRLGHNERTVLIVEGRGRRVRVGVGDASGVSIGVLRRVTKKMPAWLMRSNCS